MNRANPPATGGPPEAPSAASATSSTSTTHGARDHARAQEGMAVDDRPFVPASDAPALPADIARDSVVWAERVAAGGYTHRIVARGTRVRLTDLTGDACASVLLYNALETHERLNIADTVKVQWQVYTDAGQLLLSDQGRVLASVVADTSGHHDAIFGTTARARNAERYGDGSAHGATPAGRELLKLAGAKHGLGARDLAPCISFFQGVRIDADGAPEFLGSAGPGTSIELIAEMPSVLLIANTAHPLDPREVFTSGPLEVVAWRGEPTHTDDELWTRSPEGRRAFANTADYLGSRGIA